MVKTAGKYELGHTLGEGTFGKVKYAIHRETGEEVAIKILDKERISRQQMNTQIKKEITIMKMVKHRHVVGMREVLASQSKIFIVLELVTGGELFDKIVQAGKFNEDDARFYFRQLIEGVQYCHSLGICHRDLKPENLLLDEDGLLKISDFGLSSLHTDNGTNRVELLHTTCGTPNYVAPEVVSGKSGYDGRKADLWSTGVILYVLLAGYLPFDEPTLAGLFAKIQRAEYTFPAWFSTEARTLLCGMLTVDPTQRWGIEQIKASAWFSGPEKLDSGVDSAFFTTEVVDDVTLSGEFEATYPLDDGASVLSKPFASVRPLPLTPTSKFQEGFVYTGDNTGDSSPPPLFLSVPSVSADEDDIEKQLYPSRLNPDVILGSEVAANMKESPTAIYHALAQSNRLSNGSFYEPRVLSIPMPPSPNCSSQNSPISSESKQRRFSFQRQSSSVDATRVSSNFTCLKFVAPHACADTLAITVRDALESSGFTLEHDIERVRRSGVVRGSLVTHRGRVGVCFMVFVLYNDVCLLEATKTQGDLLEFSDLVNSLVEGPALKPLLAVAPPYVVSFARESARLSFRSSVKRASIGSSASDILHLSNDCHVGH